ncbi:hypothetical protein F5888DRAFT_656416 [Russula emetica]|nr:hypothetical protein F5888DRAFT_656416 [Russula emetica]
MKGLSSHLHAKVPPSTNEGLSGLASRRVDEYHVVSDPIVASIHYEAFSKHLTSYVEKEQANTIPRQKLAKLSLQQFQELCTDVYDELIRRQNNSEIINGQVPFLPAQAGFHPKRNQARQKLATLRPPRFQELTSDVRHDLGRRYPACNEVASAPGSTYDNLPLAGIPNVPPGLDRDTYFGSTTENYPSSRTVVKTTRTTPL